MSLDLIWTLLGFVLTVLVFSYILGDNPFFRFASYLFVGVTAGYVAALVIYQVLIPKLLWPMLVGGLPEKALAGAALLLTLFMFGRLFTPLVGLSRIPMAYLVGAGAAVVISGAVVGTIFPQAQASAAGFDLSGVQPGEGLYTLLDALLILIGTAATLAYFHFGAKARPQQTPARNPMINGLARVGQIFIGVTLGSLFAGVLASSLAALIERISFLWNTLFQQLL